MDKSDWLRSILGMMLLGWLLTFGSGCSRPPPESSAPPPPPPAPESSFGEEETFFGETLPEDFTALGIRPIFDPDSDYGGIIAERHEHYRLVRVFYGTDRRRSGELEPNDFYSGDRGSLEFGSAYVSIPERHRPGALESPSVWRLEFREDPEKHVVLMAVVPEDQETVFGQMGQIGERMGRNDVFVFVHGFNVTFKDASRRAAQLSHDMGFPGIPFLYSWPSRGSLSPLAYTADHANATWTADNLKAVLRALAEDECLGDIHLVAHSMGNHATLTALSQLSSEPNPPQLRTLVLAAPDFDADLFQRDIAPRLSQVAGQILLYASSGDRALQVSRNVWNTHRLGDSGRNIVVASGIETIDASGIDLTMLGHSYFGSVQDVMEDLSKVIFERLPAPERGLAERTHPAGVFWAIGE